MVLAEPSSSPGVLTLKLLFRSLFPGSLILSFEPPFLGGTLLWMCPPPRTTMPHTVLSLLARANACCCVPLARLEFLLLSLLQTTLKHALTGPWTDRLPSPLCFPSQFLRYQMPLSCSPEFLSVGLTGSTHSGVGLWSGHSRLCKEVKMVIWLEGKVCEICCEAAFGNRHTIFFRLNMYLRWLWGRLEEILSSGG